MNREKAQYGRKNGFVQSRQKNMRQKMTKSRAWRMGGDEEGGRGIAAKKKYRKKKSFV